MKNWSEAYRPKALFEVIGQENAIEKLENYIKNFPSKKKAVILNGPPGTGKTTLAHVIAREREYEVYELNASDLRNKSSLNEKLKPVLEQKPLFESGKIILADEVDGISGVDRGGVTELVSLIEDSEYPIICTANDAWSSKLSPLRKKCEIIEMKEISPADVKKVLNIILKKEKVAVSADVVNRIAIKSNGDLRSAINDLESASKLGSSEVIEIDARNKQTDIFKTMRYIFQDKATEEMLSAFDQVDMSLDDIILWIEENIPKVYSGADLARAYQRLAEADIFKGRIYHQQYWRFLVYENALLSYGIAEAKGKKEKGGFYKYSKPERILKMWLNNQKHAKRKSIAEKFSSATHVGQKRILREWNEIKNILKSPLVQKQLKLENEEVEYILKGC
jgi:replication factor C large subunit